jgi:hypothetical protein
MANSPYVIRRASYRLTSRRVKRLPWRRGSCRGSGRSGDLALSVEVSRKPHPEHAEDEPPAEKFRLCSRGNHEPRDAVEDRKTTTAIP